MTDFQAQQAPNHKGYRALPSGLLKQGWWELGFHRCGRLSSPDPYVLCRDPHPCVPALQAWLASPCTRDSLAKSLQSDLRWMIILVPGLTPEASAISNTPELKHEGEHSQLHSLLQPKSCAQLIVGSTTTSGVFTSEAHT